MESSVSRCAGRRRGRTVPGVGRVRRALGAGRRGGCARHDLVSGDRGADRHGALRAPRARDRAVRLRARRGRPGVVDDRLGESGDSLPYSIGRVVAWLVFPSLIYLMLAFPEGRIGRGAGRAIFRSLHRGAGAACISGRRWWLSSYPPYTPWATCRDACPPNAFLLLAEEPAAIASVVQPLRETLAVALFAAAVVVDDPTLASGHAAAASHAVTGGVGEHHLGQSAGGLFPHAPLRPRRSRRGDPRVALGLGRRAPGGGVVDGVDASAAARRRGARTADGAPEQRRRRRAGCRRSCERH